MKKIEFIEDAKFWDLVLGHTCPVCNNEVVSMIEHSWFPSFACQNKHCASLFEANYVDGGETDEGYVLEAGMISGWRR